MNKVLRRIESLKIKEPGENEKKKIKPVENREIADFTIFHGFNIFLYFSTFLNYTVMFFILIHGDLFRML